MQGNLLARRGPCAQAPCSSAANSPTQRVHTPAAMPNTPSSLTPLAQSLLCPSCLTTHSQNPDDRIPIAHRYRLRLSPTAFYPSWRPATLQSPCTAHRRTRAARRPRRATLHSTALLTCTTMDKTLSLIGRGRRSRRLQRRLLAEAAAKESSRRARRLPSRR